MKEIQISTLGEVNRDVISEINATIAFNFFKNGLKNREITRTIEGTAVKKLCEAVSLALAASADMSESQIMLQQFIQQICSGIMEAKIEPTGTIIIPKVDITITVSTMVKDT